MFNNPHVWLHVNGRPLLENASSFFLWIYSSDGNGVKSRLSIFPATLFPFVGKLTAIPIFFELRNFFRLPWKQKSAYR